MKPTCSIAGCARKMASRTWCNTHYERWRRTGSTDLAPRPSLEQRFWSKVDATGSCWEWTGARSDTGYGSFHGPRGASNAHRTSWVLLMGPIPKGLVLDHLCRNRLCVNPDHLEPVTEQVNIRRGYSPMVRASLADTCPRGHSLADAYVVRRGGVATSRQCRPCLRERQRQEYRRKRAGADVNAIDGTEVIG